jgi:hypothetical protein
MLSKILSKAECAQCQICCSFDSYDLWETPVVTDEIMKRALEINPAQQFSQISGARLFRMEREENEDLYFCPMLDRKKGCMLGDDKPFDCKIWPFRIMNFEGRRVIVLSPVCPTVFDKPISEIKALANELAPKIFEQADKTPEMVKPYIVGYPIIVTEQ